MVDPQLTLGVGSTHACRDAVLPEWGCGKAWDCGEPECQLGAHQRCPACNPHHMDHHRYYANRAQREPGIAGILQRLAALSLAVVRANVPHLVRRVAA